MKNLSVALAVRNEEANIEECLNSVKNMADEIIVFDEHSTDKTAALAKKIGAKVYEVDHEKNFHITKQKAIEKAEGKWILLLDADEIVTQSLADEIMSVINMSDVQIQGRSPANKSKADLFHRHQKVLENRDGKIGKSTGEVVAFFIPRKNLFLGKPLIHAGVYPDAVIRLIKKGKAFLPAKSVHEQMVVGGEVAWLFNDIVHNDSPTLKRYIERLNRYTDLSSSGLDKNKVPKNFIFLLYYSTLKPFTVFLKLFIRHKGFKDGMYGFVWSALSAWHFPISYYKYFISRS